MINSRHIKNCITSFPVIEGHTGLQTMQKIEIKNVYQQWKGESIQEINNKNQQTNPYSLRIGVPNTDEKLKNDNLYFILNYLSYNPASREVEKREIVTYRNMSKVFIGQSVDEYKFDNYKLFVDDNIIGKDFIFSDTEMSVKQVIMSLINKIEKLQQEVSSLKLQTKKQTIYK